MVHYRGDITADIDCLYCVAILQSTGKYDTITG